MENRHHIIANKMIKFWIITINLFDNLVHIKDLTKHSN